MGTIIDPNTGETAVNERLPKVCVGILAGGSLVDSGFAESFSGALVGHGELFWAEQIWAHGGIPDDTRNMIVEKALEMDFDYVFFMDSDHVWQKGALAKLIVAQLGIVEKWSEYRDTATVVGGIYNTRSDHRLNAYNWRDEKGFEVQRIEPMSGLHKCDFVATGAMLIDLGVFDTIPYPWFEYWYKPYGGDEGRKLLDKWTILPKWSEDAVFAKKCHDRGIPHFVDSDVVCGHLHTVSIRPVSGEEYEIVETSGKSLGIADEIVFDGGENGKS